MPRLTKRELEEENESMRSMIEQAHDKLGAALGYDGAGDEEDLDEEDEESDED
jgi:hypothetical protein